MKVFLYPQRNVWLVVAMLALCFSHRGWAKKKSSQDLPTTIHKELRPIGIGSRETVDGKPIAVREVVLEPGKDPLHIQEKSTYGGIECVVPMKKGQTLHAMLTIAGNSTLVCYDPAGTFPKNIGEDKPECEMTAEKDGNYRILVYNRPFSEETKTISLELRLDEEKLDSPPL